MANERRLIDAEELVDKLYDNEYATLCPLDEVTAVIDCCQTVDAVEVVRCGDCRFASTPKSQKEFCQQEGILKCNKHGGICMGRRVYATDYCPYGRRFFQYGELEEPGDG